MDRIIPKPRRRVAVVVIALAIFIIFISRIDFWYFSKNQSNPVLIGATVMLIIGMLYLTIKTNIGKYFSDYASKQTLDEREAIVQSQAYHKTFKFLDFIFTIIMIFVYLNDDLSVNYSKLGWGIVFLIYLSMRLLSIMIIAWTEEEI